VNRSYWAGFFLALASACGLRVSAEPVLLDGIAAIVNDTVIPLAEVRDAARVPMQSLVKRLAPFIQNRLFRAGQPIDEESVFLAIRESKEYAEEEAKIMSATLEGIIDRRLILDEFKKKGYRLPDALLEDVIKRGVRDDFRDRVTMVKTLREKGQTYEQYRQDQKDRFVVYSMVQQNLRKDLIISPKRIETYYAANPDRFKVLERVKLRLILFDRTKHTAGEPAKLAARTASRLKAGEDFATVAKEVSDDSSSRVKGGDRGWLENRDADLRRELREVAFKLAPGQVSEVVELDGSAFLLKVEEKKEGAQKPLVEVREEIELDLKKSEEERLQKLWVDRLRKNAFVRKF
jgi:peptidyl-prolyl cis-trans isomerase SurA